MYTLCKLNVSYEMLTSLYCVVNAHACNWLSAGMRIANVVVISVIVIVTRVIQEYVDYT